MSALDTFENRLLLGNISWETYVDLRECDENRAVRMTFDEGELELMSPSRLHERYSELWGRAVETWTEEAGIPIDACGSTTFRNAEVGKGLEADKWFYIQNEAVIRGKDEIDLSVDPPPDLAIEIDITSPLLPRLPVYAAMRVPEVWQWRQSGLRILVLNSEGQYEEVQESRCLPGFPFEAALRLVQSRHTADNNALFRRFRSEVRKLLSERAPSQDAGDKAKKKRKRR